MIVYIAERLDLAGGHEDEPLGVWDTIEKARLAIIRRLRDYNIHDIDWKHYADTTTEFAEDPDGEPVALIMARPVQ